MLRRFAAASGVASIAIALGALGMLISPALSVERVYPLTVIWCFVPLAWGVWAVCAPASWVPRRLPNWGAILGFMAGLLGAFVLNVPSQVLGEPVVFRLRIVVVGTFVALYYVAWMLVRAAYRSLAPRFETKFNFKWDASRTPLWQVKPQAGAGAKRSQPHVDAAQHVSEAHELLQGLRNRPAGHPDLDAAIEKLEMAVSALTIKTGGLL